jgi:hypothetical protein
MHPLLTPEIRRMQEALYGPCSRAPVPDSEVRRMLRALRGASALAGFRLWLVGSRLEPDRVDSDVDLVLSPCPGSRPDDLEIEQALWCCRLYGIDTTDPLCIVDPCFRRAGPTLEVVELPAGAIVRTTKLLSPRRWRDVAEGCILDYRLAGRFSIEYSRLAGDTNYYEKLPVAIRDGVLVRYQRPAIEVS